MKHLCSVADVDVTVALKCVKLCVPAQLATHTAVLERDMPPLMTSEALT